MSTVLILFILCFLGYCVFKRKNGGNVKPPGFPGGLPIIGNCLQFLGDSAYFWTKLKEVSSYSLEHGGMVLVRTFAYTIYFVTDPEAYEKISTMCLEKPFMYDFARDVFGDGLIISKENVWKDDRKKINPAFSQQRINDFSQIFNTNADQLVEKLAAYVGKQPVDISKDLLHCLIRVVYGTTMGLPEDDITATTYAHSIDELFNLFVLRFQKPWLILPFIYNRSTYKKQEDNYVKTIRSITEKIVQTRKSELDKLDSGAAPKILTFLDMLIKDGSFSDIRLRDHSNLMVVASYDTSRQTLLFTLMFLAQHKDVQEKVYKELVKVLKNSNSDLDRYDMAKLVYMEAVIKESLRLRPPVPIIGRHLKKDMQIRHSVLSKDSVVIISIHGLNRHPTWGPDADQFRPERWLTLGGVPDHSNVFATFGIGKRGCIGKQYALNFLKVFLAKILLKYRIRGDEDDVSMKYEVLLKAVTGHKLSFELRQ